jgi:2-C-methyl-D-erythritol 2,4-cyclodiphosphate synthase
MRIGHGVDIHRLKPGKGLTLGGVFIACDHAALAHSDGDVILHALTDALLGSYALGDIGTHFPDTDLQYKNKPSTLFFQTAFDLVTAKGGKLQNIDITVITEVPKLAPHRKAICENLAALCKLDLDRVSLKAKTNEKLDAIGHSEAIACQVVILVGE